MEAFVGESIIGYDEIKKIVDNMEKCVCKITSQKEFRFLLTGFFCKIPFPNDINKKFPVLITVNLFGHGGSYLEKSENIQIFTEGKEWKSLNLKNRIKYSSDKYDIFIMEIKEEDLIKNYLELDDYILEDIQNNNSENIKIHINEGIHIIQYANAKLSISFGSINSINKDKEYEYELSYRCGTSCGSSGSPIIRNINNKIIGIHTHALHLRDKVIKNGIYLTFPIKEFLQIYYNKDRKEFINNLNQDYRIINDDVIDEFDKKKSLNIKINKEELLDLSKRCLENNELIELSQTEFINLKELDLNHNKISDIKELEKVKLQKLEKLNLNHNKLLDIISLENIYFKQLKKLELYGNKISDIKPLEKTKLDILEYLNLGGNKISNINCLQKVNLKELKCLNLFDNEISDIKVLEYVRFEKLQLLNLGANKISDINVLENVNFKQLKDLYLQINKISNIEVFDKINFEKLELLNLRQNKINEKNNNNSIIISKMKSKIKFFQINDDIPFSSFPMYVGLIFDVSKDILEKLIKFDNTNCFFENFCSTFKGEMLALINGNNERPYYDINNIILSATNYLSYENIIAARKNSSITNQPKENIFDEECLLEIFDILESNEVLVDFINSKSFYEKILNLKNLLRKYYGAYLYNFFEHFDKLIKKPSSITLLLKKILEKYKNNYLPNKYIIIISDGNSIQNTEEVNELIKEAKENDITIVTYILSDNKEINNKVIYNEFPENLNNNLKNLFNISSKVDYKNPLVRHFTKNEDYTFCENGQGNFYLQASLDEFNTPNRNISNDLNEARYEGINIRILGINLDNFNKYKYEFLTKNQVFGTCWSNAYAALVFLTNKRILGKKLDTFETYREKLIKYASNENIDGGDIENKKVQKFFNDNRLHCEFRDEKEAKKALEKGRFIAFSFGLRDKQWTNFSNHLARGKDILDENMLNEGCNNDDSEPSGHAVLLIEINDEYARFLNSWGSNWGDAGTFKVKKASILKPINTNIEPKYYDLFFYESDLTENEKVFYKKNIDYIRWLISDFDEMSIESIKNRMNELYSELFSCVSCGSSARKDKFQFYIENGIYKMICPFCQFSQTVEGELKRLIILENLMDDGNEDFDINFRESYNIQIFRAEFHENSEFPIKNISDICSIGSENPLDQRIDPYFINNVSSIICMQNGKYIACGSNMILVFKIESSIINNKRHYNFNNLIMRNIPKEDLLSLCDLEFGEKNLFALGGEYLSIYQINYQKLDLNLRFKFNNNKKIYKIITFNSDNQDIIKRIAVCDKYGFIGFYNIKNEIINNKNVLKILFDFKIDQQSQSLYNCILYLKTERLWVLSKPNRLNFWSIAPNEIRKYKEFSDITAMKCNDNLLDIRGNLLVGVSDGINVYRYENRNIRLSFCYKNEEFGGVFSMKFLKNSDNYFICGRSYGFCSVFLLRGNHIRKINIFRNNNQSIYNERNNIKNDNYFITNICINKISRDSGYILVTSNDQTLKAYYYENRNNVFAD